MKIGKSVSKVASTLLVIGLVAVLAMSCARRSGCPGAITQAPVAVENPS